MKECEDAEGRGDVGSLYKGLKKVGTRDIKKAPTETKVTTEGFKDQFMKVSQERFENDPQVLEEAVDEAEDLRGREDAEEWAERLNRVPDMEEIVDQMKKMRDSSPGEDGVRISYLLKGGQKVLEEVVRIVQFMFQNGAETWEDALRSGVVVPLYKKGDRDDPGNYRGVCLLSIGSRILARVNAARLMKWMEAMGLVDDNQQGFRKGRSTADASQMMWRLQEDAADLKKRMEESGRTVSDEDKLTARLLDLKKAYPRVNKPALWRLLERYGLRGDFLRTLKDLHEMTEYKVRGKKGFSDTWVPERGLREGCPSSPPLFNLFHQAVMRVAVKMREKNAIERGVEAGVTFKWVPGNSLPSPKLWERPNSEAVEKKVGKSLFADDTTIVGNKAELERGVETTKEVMNRFEEKNNDDKEETLDFGEESSGGIRMLGSWMGWKQDVDERLRRANRAWWKTKNRLKGAKISKRMQARVIEASVESTLLFDCQARVWTNKEIKRMQQFVDKAYRNVWSRKTKPPLIQMEEEHKRMEDVRVELGVKSLRWKIEKRVLERIGHVMRMPDDRIVKAMVLGWVDKLEEWDRVPGGRRKTLLYWRKLLREAGFDRTKIGTLTADRKEWKKKVKERMKHVHEWECSRGYLWKGGARTRNVAKEDVQEFVFVCDVCGKVCRSKGGLTNHRKRMHEVSKLKKVFQCRTCKEDFSQEANLINHSKLCTGSTRLAHRRLCDLCSTEIGKKSFAAHRRRCEAKNGPNPEGTVPQPRRARVYIAKRKPCPECGKVLAATNMSRHLKDIHKYVT